MTSPHAVLVCGCALALAVLPGQAEAVDVQMTDYLALVAKIAPAAGVGAQTYVRAFRARCGRDLATEELRRAMSEGTGDPVLMAMIRASQLQDAAELDRLRTQVPCSTRERRP